MLPVAGFSFAGFSFAGFSFAGFSFVFRKEIEMKRQSGFTLVELVVVIVILGILAAIAVPRFTNLQREARISKVKATEGAMRSAAAMVHATATVRAGQGAVDGCTVDANGHGGVSVPGIGSCIAVSYFYPTDTLTGIVGAAVTTPTFPPDATQLATLGYTFNSGIGGAQDGIVVNGAPDANNCRVQYDAPTSAAGAPVISAYTAGC